jgi:hypothetical protein
MEVAVALRSYDSSLPPLIGVTISIHKTSNPATVWTEVTDSDEMAYFEVRSSKVKK